MRCKRQKKELLVGSIKPTPDTYFKHFDVFSTLALNLMKMSFPEKLGFNLPTPDSVSYRDEESVEEYCSECGRLISRVPKHIWQQTQWQHSK